MAMHITDGEYALGLRANQAASALGAANQQVRIANSEIARLRRQLVAANTRIGELERENRTLGERLIAMLRRH